MQIGFLHKKVKGFEYLQSPLLNEAGIKHCFTTRCGGFSEGHLSSLNLGLGRGDSYENLKRNFETVFKALGFNGESLCITKQVHDNKVCVISEPVLRSEGTDALITDKVSIPLMCYTADCVPVLLYDKRKNVCAAIHSGWRSTVKKISKEAVDALKREYKSNPSDILAAIGPCIGKCCFQVKKDVYDAFTEAFEDISFIEEEKDKIHYRVDLVKAVVMTLKEAGIMEENISVSGECTCCNTDMYFSCRGQKGNFGALGAFIELGEL